MNVLTDVEHKQSSLSVKRPIREKISAWVPLFEKEGRRGD